MLFAKQKRIMLLLISGCILILLLWFSGQHIANTFGWGWRNNLPDHLDYQGRNYSLEVISGCRTRTATEKLFPALMQFGTLPMLFGSSYLLFAPENQMKNHGTVMSILAKQSETCYKTYTLEGGP